MVQKDEWLQAEGDCFPGKTYAEVVLEPAYEQAKAELLSRCSMSIRRIC